MPYVEATDANFEAVVLAKSDEVPVVVDLWAEWCGPCKTLGPIIERVIDETKGKVVLAKVDVDANPRTAQAFRVQSIPAVYAVHHRQVVDQFIGALPEATVRQFIDKLAPPETEVDRLLAAGDETSLRRALELEPANAKVVVNLAEVLVGKGTQEARDEALTLLAKVPETGDSKRVAALARVGSSVPPDGMEAKLDALLDRVKADEDARREFIDLLEVMGPDDPRTAQYRKAMTSRIF